MSDPHESTEQPVALVTGTSSGIGAARRAALSSAGRRTFGGSRHAGDQDPDTVGRDARTTAALHTVLPSRVFQAGMQRRF